MKRVVVVCLLLFLFSTTIAVAIRLPRLSARPMHADEAVQAARFRDLWLKGRFIYDPNEFHGPTLIYATLPSAKVSRAASFADTTEVTYRVVPALFGVGLVVLIFLLSDGLGLTATATAAVLAAISPAMVFYSRYYIHETLLAFFTLAAIACGWRYVSSRKLVWCLLAGVCVGLMQATKETAVIAYLAATFASIITVWGARRILPPEEAGPVPWSRLHLTAGVLVALFVTVTLLSSFFTNLRGPIDGVLTYAAWLSRAGGAFPARKSLVVLFTSACLVACGDRPRLVGGTDRGPGGNRFREHTDARRRRVTSGRAGLVRWLAGYTFAVTVAYSVIPYKTPWCLIQFLLGMILLAGVGASVLLPLFRPIWLKIIIATLLVVGAGQLAWQAYRASFVIPANVGNPYVFAQTSPDVLRLAEQVRQLAEASDLGWQTPVKVIWNDAYYWPLPWYLRRFEQVELWRSFPDNPAAPVVISSPQFVAQLDQRLGTDYLLTDYYEIRPQVLAQLWVRVDLWETHLRRLGRIE